MSCMVCSQIEPVCLAESPDAYLSKGGDLADTVGRKCLCNGLMANIGLAQVRRDEAEEAPLATCGDDRSDILRVAGPEGSLYTADDVIAFLLAPVAT